MKAKYTTILYDEKREMGVSLNEYVILDIIFHLENNPKFDGCRAKPLYFSECLDISERSVKRILAKLEKEGWVVSVGTGGKSITASRKTTTKYKNIRQQSIQNETVTKGHSIEEETAPNSDKMSANSDKMSANSDKRSHALLYLHYNNSIAEKSIEDKSSKHSSKNKREQVVIIPYVAEEYLKELSEHKEKRMKVIAWFIRIKKLDISTLPKAQSVIKRNLKPAQELIAYSGKEIGVAFQKCLDSSKGEYEVTLETILKKLTTSKI